MINGSKVESKSSDICTAVERYPGANGTAKQNSCLN